MNTKKKGRNDMKMKKSFLIILVIVCQLSAMKQFSEKSKKRFLEGVEQHIKLGSTLPNSATNGILKVCKELREKLSKQEPHELPTWSLANKLLTKISSHESYKTAFDTARKKSATASDAKQQDQAWLEFRKSAAHLLADEVESRTGTTLKYNRGQEKWADLFNNNHNLDPNSEDGEYFEASIISLYGLYDIKEEAKKAS